MSKGGLTSLTVLSRAAALGSERELAPSTELPNFFARENEHHRILWPRGVCWPWLHRILKEERDTVISSRPLEATAFQVENIRIAYVFYESGLSINVMYTVDDPTSARSGSSSPKGWTDVPTASRLSARPDRATMARLSTAKRPAGS
jgi:hypothetical protein